MLFYDDLINFGLKCVTYSIKAKKMVLKWIFVPNQMQCCIKDGTGKLSDLALIENQLQSPFFHWIL